MIRIHGTFDIECASWDRFATAATYQPAVGSLVHRSIPELTTHLLKCGGTWWAHCGGSYDFLAIAEELRKRGIACQVYLSGSRISRLIGGGVTLCDSFALVPMSLDVAAPIAGLVAPTLALACRCSEACGGYCSINPTAPCGELDDYCRADCHVLYVLLTAISDHASEQGYELRGTLGGTAWATAKKWLELPDAEFPTALWRRIRASYYGGRVTVLRPRAKGPGSHWDIRSAYPAALSTVAVPVGEPDEYGGRRAAKCLARDMPGIYACRVTVPEMLLPPLPWRYAGRVQYPTGSFAGVWTLLELRAAEARGARIEQVLWCIAWDDSCVVFGELMANWYQTRSRVGRDTPLGQWQSLLCKSLTGKLAESPERHYVRMHPSEIKICQAKAPCTRDKCCGACGAYRQVDLWGEVWSVPFYRPSRSGHMHWASYLTAQTRIDWLTGAESQGEQLVYGDTDSLWTLSRRGPRPQGNGLGQWSYKHGFTSWECPAPKSYRFIGDDGVPVVRAAGGTRISDGEWLAGEAKQERGVVSFLEAAASSRGLFRRKSARWTLPGHQGKEGWYGDRRMDVSREITYPPTDVEIRQKAKSVAKTRS